MAEPYQLPGQFQVPSMAEISYAAGDQQAGANAQWKMFTDQVTAYTNIENANRAQSLRERDFAQRVIQNDRDFELRRELQDENLRVSNLNFEVARFNFDRSREAYNQLQDAWSQREDWMKTVDDLMPNGGNSPTYLADKARVFRMFAKSPASFTVLSELLKPYDDQYKVYQANKSLEDEAYIQSAFDNGMLDGETIGDQDAAAYWRETLLNRDIDPLAYSSGMRNLRRIADSKFEAQKQATAFGAFEAQRTAAGLPPSEITMEDGKIKYKAAAPRMAGAPGAGIGQIAGATKNYIEIAQSLGKEAEDLQIKADELEEGLEKEALKSQIDNRKREQQRYIDLARQTSATGAPTQVPAMQQTQGAAGVLGAPPSKAPKIKDFKTPTTAPAPQSSAKPTQTPELKADSGTVVGYITEEGSQLTESEAKARMAAGQKVIPIKTPAVKNPFGEKVTNQGIIGAISG